MKIETRFTPGDTVRLIGLDLDALVDSVRVGLGGLIEYYVVYWNAGERTSVWVHEMELQRKEG